MSKFSATLPAQTAAGGTSTTYAGTFEPEQFQSDTVRQVIVTAPPGYTTVTGAATNNATINVRQVRNGTVVATFASLTLSTGVNLVAETPVNVPVSVQPILQAGDVVDVQLVQNASGLAINANLNLSVFVN